MTNKGQQTQIHTGECLEWLKTLPDNSCDIFTDPPYNVAKQYGVWNDSLPDQQYKDWIAEVLTECKRIANVLTIYVPHKWNLFYWNVLGEDFTEVIMTNRALNSFRSGFVNRYNKLLTNSRPEKIKQISNVWENIPMPGTGYFFREQTFNHPGYTSEAISKRVVVELCKSDTILDPFTGTGTTAIAALYAGKKFIGCEINPEYIKIAERRIKQHINELKLF